MQINYLTLDKDRKAATTTTITKANKHVIKKYGKEPRKATRKAKWKQWPPTQTIDRRRQRETGKKQRQQQQWRQQQQQEANNRQQAAKKLRRK